MDDLVLVVWAISTAIVSWIAGYVVGRGDAECKKAQEESTKGGRP